ncbi:MAG: sigma-54-dependent Fis family transcriptional regulator [Magnetococcales bacterium]|nr:sigma-54-dependent Fis family transcriptional regulator [Magnetococcales bacterium]NGZ04925.1 sigma-54-dependent Fis family transcriptional regulator [Magnetococcales bacterium]
MSEPVKKSLPIVLVDDEETVLFSSKILLKTADVSPVVTLTDGRQLLPFLEEHGAAVVVLDLVMPFASGNELLPKVKERYPEIPVIVMTANQEVEIAVQCMKDGAFDYLVKPAENSRFISSIKRAMEVRSLQRELGTLKHYLLEDSLQDAAAFAAILTQSRKMRAVFQYVEAIAPSSEPVLIIGETGVGKELLAQAIHQVSHRQGPLVALNVAGLDDNMFSDTLFGHRKGAFTGANDNREGMIAAAAGGSLFLDEIGDLKESSQVKLLRLLQERKYYPLGSDGYMKTDARIICATNRDLKEMMAEKSFRSDLYFRLSSHQVRIPPLRERKEDLLVLTTQFIEEAAQAMGKSPPVPPPELFHLLNTYDFPGNVRELRAIVFDAVARHHSGLLSLERFRETILSNSVVEDPLAVAWPENPFKRLTGKLPTLRETETLLIEEALERSQGNKSLAATLLGISRQTLNYRLQQLKKGSSAF